MTNVHFSLNLCDSLFQEKVFQWLWQASTVALCQYWKLHWEVKGWKVTLFSLGGLFPILWYLKCWTINMLMFKLWRGKEYPKWNPTLFKLYKMSRFGGFSRVHLQDIVIHDSRASKQTKTSWTTQDTTKHMLSSFLKPMTNSVFELLIPYHRTWGMKPIVVKCVVLLNLKRLTFTLHIFLWSIIFEFLLKIFIISLY